MTCVGREHREIRPELGPLRLVPRVVTLEGGHGIASTVAPDISEHDR